jgi:benzoyl-CoA reductase/2-hydroxyglutaryl-CoA dehydratase subunit BcrC/BadD/HgdB
MKSVVYSSPFVPAEWIAAHGVRPMRLRPDPAAALPSTGPLMGVCPYARAFTSEAGTSAGAVIFTTTCDQMRRAAEWLSLEGTTPVFLMNVPATWQTPAAARLYRDELQRLGRFLVALGGAEPSRDRLAATMETYDARRRLLRGDLAAMTARGASEAIARFDLGEEPGNGGPPPGTAAPLMTLRGGSPDPPRRNAASSQSLTPAGAAGRETRRAKTETLRSPTSHVEEPAAHKTAASGAAVAVIGGPLARGDGRLFDALEKAGGRVALDGTESGPRTFPAPFDRRRLRDDPLMELVDAYFGTIPDAFRRPDTLLYQWLSRELAASAARGIIVWRYVWCDMWAAAAARLREATALPVLDLDVTGDASEFGRAANRIQAFMEVLK